MAQTDLSPVLVTARQRERQALDLRAGGATFARIGQALGVTPQGAHKAVSRALKATVKEIAGEADKLRALDAERLDTMLAAVWPAVVDGDLGAIDRAVRILDRRSRLLGLDLRPPEVAAPAPRWSSSTPDRRGSARSTSTARRPTRQRRWTRTFGSCRPARRSPAGARPCPPGGRGVGWCLSRAGRRPSWRGCPTLPTREPSERGARLPRDASGSGGASRQPKPGNREPRGRIVGTASATHDSEGLGPRAALARAEQRHAAWSGPPPATLQVPWPTGPPDRFFGELARRGRLTPEKAEGWAALWPRLVLGEESRTRIIQSLIGLRSPADLARDVASHVGPGTVWGAMRRPARRQLLRALASSMGAWKDERRTIRSLGRQELAEAAGLEAEARAEHVALFAGGDMPAPVNEHLSGEERRWSAGARRRPPRAAGPGRWRLRARLSPQRRVPRRTVARRRPSARRAGAPPRGPPADSGDSDPAGETWPPARQGTRGGREDLELDRLDALRRAGRYAGIPHVAAWLDRLAAGWCMLGRAPGAGSRAPAARRPEGGDQGRGGRAGPGPVLPTERETARPRAGLPGRRPPTAPSASCVRAGWSRAFARGRPDLG